MTETVHLKGHWIPVLVTPPPTAGLTVRIDGTEYGPFTVSLAEVAILNLETFTAPGTIAHCDFDDFKFGTTGYGSSDVFADDFSSGPVPPWDTLYGTHSSESGGIWSVNSNPGDFDALEKNVTPVVVSNWTQFRVRFKADMLAANPTTFLIDLYSTGYAVELGLQLFDVSTGEWAVSDNFAAPITFTDAPLVADTWYTIDLQLGL